MTEVELTWKNLTLKTPSGMQILNDISGQVQPGKLTAIMGPSGSGKTCLLNCLAGRISTKLTLKGEIFVNGQTRNPTQWPKIISYMSQELHALNHQTVFETIRFAAYAKLNKNINILEKVDETICMLGLDSIRNSYLNNLSGGERVKVGIAIEYIGDPCILFLDEPTSGLDSSNAMGILDILQKLSKLNKTIVLTIHQPSYKLLRKIDNLILMSKGMTVFDGTIDGCIQFFDDAGFKVPENTNPTTFFLETINIDTTDKEAKQTNIESYRKLTDKWNEIKQIKEPRCNDIIAFDDSTRTHSMFSMLFAREAVEITRNKHALYAKLVQKIIVGLFFGFTFFQTTIANANIFSLRGVLTFFLINNVFAISAPILNQFAPLKKVLKRERMSGFYNGFEAYFSKFLALAISNLIFEIPYNAAVYYIVGLNSNFFKFLIFLLIICSVIIFSISFGLTFSIATPNLETAQILGSTVNFFYILYSGAFTAPSSIPAVLRWLVYTSPLFYGFTAILNNQLSGEDVNGIPGKEVIKEFGLDSVSLVACMMIILCFVLILQLVGAFALEVKIGNNLNIQKKKKEDSV